MSISRILTAVCISTAPIVVAVASAADPVEIDVDCSVRLAQGAGQLKYGVCMNYLIDSDAYDAEREHKIRESLRKLKVKAVRWNEGEIGDKMIWSVPSFFSINLTRNRLIGLRDNHLVGATNGNQAKLVPDPMRLATVAWQALCAFGHCAPRALAEHAYLRVVGATALS